jgi:hypothetical protein
MASTSSSNTTPLHQTAPREAPKAARSLPMTAEQIEALADRLLSRGICRLHKDAPHLAGDLRTAGHVIRDPLFKLDEAAFDVAETHRVMAEINIAVEA